MRKRFMKKEDFLVEKYGKKNVGMDDLKKEDKMLKS